MAEQKKQEQDTNQLLKVRREKLAELQANGKDPFQITKFNQTHHSLEVKEIYEAHEAELLKDHKEPEVEGLDEEQKKEVLKKDYEERRSIMDANPIHVAVAGRMMFKRVMGKASFCNIQDLQGNIQVYVARDAIGTDSYADFKKSDIGDIFGLEGFAFRTRTGEISIHAEKMTLLSKSLQILPEKFHGLTDTDTRYRQRYVDLIMNQESKKVFIKRSQILKVEDLLAHKTKTESKLDKAKDYLRLLLNGTDMACADIFDKMRANGIGKRTVEQAKKDMGIISYKLGDKWYWQLNGSDASGERI